MTADHAALMAELRAIALAALDRLEPILERAAQAASESTHDGPQQDPGTEKTADDAAGGTSGCSWCPVCALVALVKGEPHDLVTLVSTQIAALLALVRALLAEYDGGDGPDGGGSDGDPQATRSRAFVPIQVRIEDNPEA